MSVLFKLKNRSTASARQDVHRTLDKLKASARPLLPSGTAAGALADVFAVDVSSAEDGKIISRLSKLPAVEYAEAQPRRRVM